MVGILLVHIYFFSTSVLSSTDCI